MGWSEWQGCVPLFLSSACPLFSFCCSRDRTLPGVGPRPRAGKRAWCHSLWRHALCARALARRAVGLPTPSCTFVFFPPVSFSAFSFLMALTLRLEQPMLDRLAAAISTSSQGVVSVVFSLLVSQLPSFFIRVLVAIDSLSSLFSPLVPHVPPSLPFSSWADAGPML